MTDAQRRVVRLVVSAVAAGGIAGLGVLLAAFAGGNTMPNTAQWCVAGITGALQMLKDVQSSLSEPPLPTAMRAGSDA